jgi:hypothetical protein
MAVPTPVLMVSISLGKSLSPLDLGFPKDKMKRFYLSLLLFPKLCEISIDFKKVK